MSNTRPITAWGPDGKSVITFYPSPNIKLRQHSMLKYKQYDISLKSLIPAIQRMRMLGNTFKHIAQELGISITTAHRYHAQNKG